MAEDTGVESASSIAYNDGNLPVVVADRSIWGISDHIRSRVRIPPPRGL